jgi:hypothetical protein
MIRSRDAKGRFIRRTVPHVNFPVQRHDWQALILTVITAAAFA